MSMERGMVKGIASGLVLTGITASPSTDDTRSDTRTLPPTALLLSESRLVTRLLLVSDYCDVVNRGSANVRLLTGQCRPLSKTVRFNVLRVSKNKAAKGFAKF